MSSNDLQENTDEMWDNNLNPSQIIVNASAGRSNSTRVMMLIPRPLIEYSVLAQNEAGSFTPRLEKTHAPFNICKRREIHGWV